MNKKEQQQLEDALTLASFCRTQAIAPDVHPPTAYGELSKGYAFVGSLEGMRVEKACSGASFHGIGSDEKTTSQRAMMLYSTKLLALRAARNSAERACAAILRRIDREIESEISSA